MRTVSMSLPHTAEIDASGIELHLPENGLFAFCMSELEEETYLQDFISSLDEYLPGFVFSKRNLELKQEQYDSGATTLSPVEQARRLLQKTTEANLSSNGEFGEFLLYLFAKEVVGANKTVSKIQTRGGTKNTLPGRDGIYMLADEEGNVYMLAAEAKLKPDSNDGLREAQGDLNDFWEIGDVDHEILLASTHLVDEITPENYSKYVSYFLEGNPDRAELKYQNIVFVGYSFDSLTNLRDGSMDSDSFSDAVRADLKRCFLNQEELIKKGGKTSIYCFLPFEDIAVVRKKFAEHHNLIIPK